MIVAIIGDDDDYDNDDDIDFDYQDDDDDDDDDDNDDGNDTWAATSQAISVLEASCPFTNTLDLHLYLSLQLYFSCQFILSQKSHHPINLMYFVYDNNLNLRLGPAIVDVNYSQHVPGERVLQVISFYQINLKGQANIGLYDYKDMSVTTCEAGTHI